MFFGRNVIAIIVLLIVSCFICFPLSAAVLIVGPGHSYTEIQDAVDAASDGDTILVKPANYTQGFVIDDKTLFVVGDVPPGTYVKLDDNVTTRNLKSHRTVVLSNFSLSSTESDTVGLVLDDNAGSVRIESCRIYGPNGYAYYDPWVGWVFFIGSEAVYVDSCADVAFGGCRLEGGRGFDGDLTFGGDVGYEGLEIVSSIVCLYDCDLYGGDGGHSLLGTDPAGPGGDGCRVSGNSHLFASGCGFYGGDGGNAKWFPAGTGGNGVYVKAPANVELLDNIYQGGQGGWDMGGQAEPGKGISGTAHLISGSARKLEIPRTAREKDLISLVFHGLPGDLAGLLLTLFPDTQFMMPLKGQLLLSLMITPVYLYVGKVPGSGSLTWTLGIPKQGPAFEAITIYTQAVFAEGAGNLTLGSQGTLVILDESY